MLVLYCIVTFVTILDMSHTTDAENYLYKTDDKLRTLISKYGRCDLMPHTRYYEELASSIIGQQLSTKVAATIWKRFLELYGGSMPSPEQIINTDIEQLRGIGCSYAKARYVQDLAGHIVSGKLDLAHISTMPNNDVISQLTDVKGIGEWSAHMFLIFCLGRLDILPWGDLGIRKAAQIVYDMPALPNKADLAALAESHHWHPYESVASWYLWKFLDNT
jgi:DNA-3-methyladenine glycosylase II